MKIKNDKLAWLITHYLLEFGYVPHENYDGVLDWLNLCTNIKNVDFDIGKYDEGLLYCGSAWNSVCEQTEIWKNLNIKLIQFNYSWCALETVIDLQVDEQLISRNGKINAACMWLKQHLQITDIPEAYINIYDKMIRQLKSVLQFEKDLQKLGISDKDNLPNKECANRSGAGLLVVYKIRNRFAHGSLSFPTPSDYDCDTDECITPELIDYAISIVLFSIVMILLIDCKEFDELVYDATYCESIEGKKPSEFLKSIETYL
jgi:hypothetical protein